MSKAKQDYASFLGQIIGAASMCWEPLPSTQVFDSVKAKALVENLENYISQVREEAKAEVLSKKKRIMAVATKDINDKVAEGTIVTVDVILAEDLAQLSNNGEVDAGGQDITDQTKA